ncbi:MAG: porin, partial [Gammaproteobacteria bacterium]
MDKKILSTAIAGVLAGSLAFAANADVTLYGQVDVSIDATDQDGGSDDVNMNSNQSAIGVKGSEDLGNGLSAIFLLEYQVDPSGTATSAGGFTGRDQYIGMKGGFGQVAFGTASTSYKSHGAMIDPLYRTSLQGRARGLQSFAHSGDGEDGEGRMTNQIRYDSPDYSGFSLTANYNFDSNE